MAPRATTPTATDADLDDAERATRALNGEAAAFLVEDTFEGRYRIFRFASKVLAAYGACSPSDAARAAFRPDAFRLGLAMLAYFVDVCGASTQPDVVHDIWTALQQTGKAFRAGHRSPIRAFSGAWDAVVVDMRRRRSSSCLRLYRHGVRHVLGGRAATVEEAVRGASCAELEAAIMHGALSGDVRGATLDSGALLADMGWLLAWRTAVRARAARRREARVLARRDTNAGLGERRADGRENGRSRARGRENQP